MSGLCVLRTSPLLKNSKRYNIKKQINLLIECSIVYNGIEKEQPLGIVMFSLEFLVLRFLEKQFER